MFKSLTTLEHKNEALLRSKAVKKLRSDLLESFIQNCALSSQSDSIFNQLHKRASKPEEGGTHPNNESAFSTSELVSKHIDSLLQSHKLINIIISSVKGSALNRTVLYTLSLAPAALGSIAVDFCLFVDVDGRGKTFYPTLYALWCMDALTNAAAMASASALLSAVPSSSSFTDSALVEVDQNQHQKEHECIIPLVVINAEVSHYLMNGGYLSTLFISHSPFYYPSLCVCCTPQERI